MKYLFVLINCCYCINFTENIYHVGEDRIVKKNFIRSDREKQVFLELNKHNVIEEVFDRIARPVTKDILIHVESENVTKQILEKYNVQKSKKIGFHVVISLKEDPHFSSTVNEIESTNGVLGISFFDYISLKKREPFVKRLSLGRNRRILTESENYPNDPAFDLYQRVYFTSINHPITNTRNHLNGSGVSVTILDDSIDTLHSDFNSENINIMEDHLPVASWDSIHTHGTRVAGIIAANTNNNVDIAGASSNVKINFVSFYDCSFSQCSMRGLSDLFFNIIMKNNYDDVKSIVSNSWGSIAFVGSPYWEQNRRYIEEVVKTFRNGLGGILIFSSGNGRLQKNYAHYSLGNTFTNTITVGSLSVENNMIKVSDFSEECSCLTVSAPGENIYSLWPGNYIASSSGSSFSAPFVASAVSMLLQIKPFLKNIDVISLLMKSASKNINTTFSYNAKGFGYSNRVGAGILNVTKLLEMAEKWVPLNSHVIENVISKDVGDRVLKPNQNEIYEFDIVNENIAVQSLQITLNAHFSWYQNLKIEVISPSGTIGEVVTDHNPYEMIVDENGLTTSIISDYYYRRYSEFNVVPWFYTSYSFKTNQFLDEDAYGTWKVKITHGGHLDMCDDSCEFSNDNTCDDLYDSTPNPYMACHIGTDCSDCTNQFLGSAFRYPYMNDTIHDVKVTVNGFVKKEYEMTPKNSNVILCNVTMIVDKIDNKVSDHCTDLFSFDNYDSICTCLDFYSEPYDFNCLIGNTISGKTYDFKSLLQICRTREIMVNINSILNIQEECCGDDCKIYLNKTHYTTIYKNSSIS